MFLLNPHFSLLPLDLEFCQEPGCPGLDGFRGLSTVL
jgi:hypothetical protein